MNLGDYKFNKKKEYSDDKYSVFSFSGEKGKFRRLVCEKESLCIFPFDLNNSDQIQNVYVSKYHDYHTNSPETCCITKTFDPNKFDSHYDAMCSILKEELGVNDVELDDIYYLGKVKHTVPFTKEYRCYAVNLSNSVESPGKFKVSIPQSEKDKKLYSIDCVRFNRIVNGEINDSLSLACALLLLSYLND
jgi:hypothetical protein